MGRGSAVAGRDILEKGGAIRGLFAEVSADSILILCTCLDIRDGYFFREH